VRRGVLPKHRIAARFRGGEQVSGVQSLIDEVETSFRSGTASSRAEMLRRITDLFLAGAGSFEEQQVGVFDDVLCDLIGKIEREAVATLSQDIAAHANAQRALSRRLSQHDDIAVAGPVLRHSVVLSENDLVEVARTKSQSHLEAIANRAHVSERVSDVLIDRGNSAVLTTVAGNTGARFSVRGYNSLLGTAENDANIASAVIGRSDLTPEMFRKLVAQASATVQRKLLANADPGMREKVQGVVQLITVDISRKSDRAVSMRGQAGSQLKTIDKGKLREELVDYATAGRAGETATALAALSELSIDAVRRLLNRRDYELLLIVCKACGLGWVAVRALLDLAAQSRDEFSFNSAGYLDQYNKLSREAADRVMRFLKVRKTASSADIKKMMAG
jgi:uncharacterized protein (DUF2336 family)